MTEEELPLCECGCDEPVAKIGNRFINGHNYPMRDPDVVAIRNKKRNPNSPAHNAAISKALTGRTLSDDHLNSVKKARTREKEPLPNDWEFDKNSKMVTNKESTQYLGCYIAEQVLSKIFKDVQVMPYGNIGYDIICSQNRKIEIKSSATGYQGWWTFGIKKNEIADYFLFLAFESRKNLVPVHLWLIPGNIINHFTGITILKKSVYKWSKYEQPLDKVIACCNAMTGE